MSNIKLEIINKRPCILKDKDIFLSDISAGTRYWGTMYNVLKDYTDKEWTLCDFDIEGERYCYEAIGKYEKFAAKTDNAKIYVIAGTDRFLIKSVYKNTGERKSCVDMMPVRGMLQNGVERVLWNTQAGNCAVKAMDMDSETFTTILETDGVKESCVNVALSDYAENDYVIGFVSYDRYFSGVRVHEDGEIECQLYRDTEFIEKDEEIESDWILFSMSDNLLLDLIDYTSLIRDFNGFREKRPPVTGYCTWYYYMGNIRAETVLDDLEECYKMRDKVPLDLFQIDAGWSKGEKRETNEERFPGGMKYYADRIKEKGMTPGIWLSPFDFPLDSELAKSNPDMFAKNPENGELLVYKNHYILDATGDEGKAFIKELYERITYEWGFRYLKIDIIADYLTPAKYQNGGSLQNLREYFKTVKEVCHPDTFVLACTSPLFEVAEFIDGARTSPDIFERWDSLSKVFSKNLKRYYVNETLFNLDPDCLIIRKKENEDKECRRFCSRTDDEIITFMTAMYMCGGNLIISDRPGLMTEKQKDYWAKFFPRNYDTAIPLDLMSSRTPQILDLDIEGETYRKIGIINWSETEKTYEMDLGAEYEMTEHWTGEDLGRSGKLSVTLKPHCSALFFLKNI